MNMVNMQFHVGDQVVHWSYGPGKILQLDEKELSGRKSLYYVVQIEDLMIWVPVAEAEKRSLRFLTPAREFEECLAVFDRPADDLPIDRLERKIQLTEAMKDGTLESICRVIRDLMTFSKIKKLNDHDNAMLERAQSFLLNEWRLSLSISYAQAEQELKDLLETSPLVRE